MALRVLKRHVLRLPVVVRQLRTLCENERVQKVHET